MPANTKHRTIFASQMGGVDRVRPIRHDMTFGTGSTRFITVRLKNSEACYFHCYWFKLGPQYRQSESGRTLASAATMDPILWWYNNGFRLTLYINLLVAPLSSPIELKRLPCYQIGETQKLLKRKWHRSNEMKSALPSTQITIRELKRSISMLLMDVQDLYYSEWKVCVVR